MKRDRTIPPPGFDDQRPSVRDLIWAYRHGWFPMAEPETGRVDWYSPYLRGVLPLLSFHVPVNLAKEVRRRRVDIRCDTAFEAVMRACAEPRRDADGTWLNDNLISSYVALHRAGQAHSIEAWREGTLVGGLYGVHVGGAFFGESMFSRPALGGSNASKICLVHLVRWMRRRGFTLLDTQMWSEHLEQFGCEEVTDEAYLELLAPAIDLPVIWGEFTSDEA